MSGNPDMNFKPNAAGAIQTKKNTTMATAPHMIHKWSIKEKGNLRTAMAINSLQHLLWSSAFQTKSAQVSPLQNWAMWFPSFCSELGYVHEQEISSEARELPKQLIHLSHRESTKNLFSSFSAIFFQSSVWHRVPVQSFESLIQIPEVSVH